MPETTTKANDTQVGGNHYKKMPIEHWDLSVLYDMDPFQYQITKYVLRWRDKNGIQDLEKVVHFAQKYVEIEKLRASGKLTETILQDVARKLAIVAPPRTPVSQKEMVAGLLADIDGLDNQHVMMIVEHIAARKGTTEKNLATTYHGPRPGYGSNGDWPAPPPQPAPNAR